MNLTRYDRQEKLFGKTGQDLISATRVAIIGLGGTGSQVAQQLAYLGVRKFCLIDFDVVELSNLNRLIGAGSVSVGKKKVKNANDLIRYINPEAEILCFEIDLRRGGLRLDAALRACNYIFGCVDNDAARLALLTISARYGIPLIDIAAEARPADREVGGEVFFFEGKGCLLCGGLLDQKEIRHFNGTETDRQFEKEVYGISKETLAGGGPTVVMINGLAASIAATEFMYAVTELSPPLTYTHIHRQSTFPRWGTSHDITFNKDCYYCHEFRHAVEEKRKIIRDKNTLPVIK